MKIRTLILLKKYINNNQVHFPENISEVQITLNRGEIKDLLAAEYSIRPKKQKIIKKRLRRLFNDLLKYVIEGQNEKK